MVTAPGEYEVREVAPPAAAAGQVVVDVERVGVCGTDVEFFTGDMPYLHDGHAEFPMRLGHEWCGVVVEVGDGVDGRWLGRRVTGDTMLGCGACRRCRRGNQHVCEFRFEWESEAGSPEHWQSGWPCLSPRCTIYPTRWTTYSGRWSSRAETRSARFGVPVCRPGIDSSCSAPAPSACSSPSSPGLKDPRFI